MKQSVFVQSLGDAAHLVELASRNTSFLPTVRIHLGQGLVHVTLLGFCRLVANLILYGVKLFSKLVPACVLVDGGEYALLLLARLFKRSE